MHPAGQPAGRHVGAHPRQHGPEDDLGPDAVTERTEEVGELEHAGREDHGGREQEREAHGVLTPQSGPHPRRHGHARAGDPGTQGQDLHAADAEGPGEGHPRQSRVRGDPVGDRVAGDLGRDRLRRRVPADPPLGRKQDQAVGDQEAGRGHRPSEVGPQPVLEQQADQTDRDGAHDQLPDEPLVGGGDAPASDAGEEAPGQPEPVAAVEDEQGEGGGHVRPDDEGEVRRLRGRHVQVAGPAAAQHRRQQHAVSEAGDREELGHALQEAHDRGLEPAQVVHAGPLGPGHGRSQPGGANLSGT